MWRLALCVPFFSACRTNLKEPGLECVLDSDCPNALLCVQNQCASVECYAHDDCGYGYLCQDDGFCAVGCNEYAACPAGEACDDGLCMPETCVDTELDCALGELCEAGVCTEPDFPLCQSCTFSDWQNAPLENGACVIYTFDTSRTCSWPDSTSCPDFWSCFPSDGLGLSSDGFCVASFWYLYCSEQVDCPRGLSCDIILGDNEPAVCWADCLPFLENGFVESQ